MVSMIPQMRILKLSANISSSWLNQAFRTSSDENIFQLQPIYGKVVADQKTSIKSNRLYIVCTLSLISLNEQPHLLHTAICR